jgi:hypothetical protein
VRLIAISSISVPHENPAPKSKGDVIDIQAAGIGQFKPTVPMKGDARDLVISDVADFDSAGVHVSQHHVCFAEAAEIAEIHELPFETDRAQERGIGGVVVADVVDLLAVLLLRKIMSVVSVPLKPPRPTNCQSVPTWPKDELRNVDANYLFERSHRFAGIQPNSGFGDYSRLSCGVGDTQLGRS